MMFPESDTLVAFDWNGTLVNDLDRALKATNSVLVEYELPVIARNQFHEKFTLPLTTFFSELGVPTGCEELAAEIWNRNLAQHDPPPAMGAVEGLKDLSQAGYVCAVITACSWSAFGADLSHVPLGKHLALAFAGVDSKQYVLKRLRSWFSSVFYVGDTPYDLREAREADVVGVGVRGGYAPSERLAAAPHAALVDDLFGAVEFIKQVTPTVERVSKES